MSQPLDPVSPRSICVRVQELLGAEHDGEAVLDPLVAEHVRGCEACGELRSALRDLSDAFAPLRAAFPPSADLWARIEARAASLPRRASARARALSSLGASLLGAAAAVTLLVALDAKRGPSAVRLRSDLTRPFELLAEQANDSTRRLTAIPEIRLALSLSPPEDRR
jgi:hypothetical protein